MPGVSAIQDDVIRHGVGTARMLTIRARTVREPRLDRGEVADAVDELVDVRPDLCVVQHDQRLPGAHPVALRDEQLPHDTALEVLDYVDRSGRHDLAVADRGFLDFGDAGQQNEAADQDGKGDQQLAQQAGRAGLLQQ